MSPVGVELGEPSLGGVLGIIVFLIKKSPKEGKSVSLPAPEHTF